MTITEQKAFLRSYTGQPPRAVARRIPMMEKLLRKLF